MRGLTAVLTVGLVLAQEQPGKPSAPVVTKKNGKVKASVPAVKTPDGKLVEVKTLDTPPAGSVTSPSLGAPSVATPGVKVSDVKAPEVSVAKPKIKKPRFSLRKPKADRDLARMGNLKEAAIGVPSGSPLTVGVKGAGGKTEKVYGRMGNVTNDGFSMQALRNGNLENMQLDFKDVASMKAGARQSRLRQVKGPLLGAMSLMTLAGTVIAIVKK